MRSATDDLTASARIRDAAMTLFAERGYTGVSIRDAASAAGVSPSLVVHHFGSKAGLRAAVDTRAVAMLTQVLAQAATAVGGDEPAGAMGQSFATALGSEPSLVGYLRRMLIEGGEAAGELFTQLLDATEGELERMVALGLVRPSVNPRWRAAFLLCNDLAVLLLEDLVTASLGQSPMGEGLPRWTQVLMQTYTEGVFVAPTDAQPPSSKEGQ